MLFIFIGVKRRKIIKNCVASVVLVKKPHHKKLKVFAVFYKLLNLFLFYDEPGENFIKDLMRHHSKNRNKESFHLLIFHDAAIENRLGLKNSLHPVHPVHSW